MPSSKPHSATSQSSSETTPLLQAIPSTASLTYNGSIPSCSNTDTASPPSPSSPSRRLSTMIASSLLCASVLGILSIGFLAPAAATQYAKEAIVLDVLNLSIESFIDRGVQARIQASVTVDASRVKNGAVRTFGKVGTWLAQSVSAEESVVHVYLPDYNNDLLGTATAPAMIIDIRNGHMSLIDFVSNVEIGSLDAVGRVANDYFTGALGLLRVRGETDLILKAGLLQLGAQRISEEMTFEELPSLPNVQVNRLNFGEITLPDQKAMSANISVTIRNPYPLELEVPPLSFAILLPGCRVEDLVFVATAETPHILVKPKLDIDLDLSSIIQTLPDNFTTICPKSHKSPMDKFLGNYLHGTNTTIYTRGSGDAKPGTPRWLLELLQSITFPVPFPGHTFDKVVESLSLSDVKLRLPIPEAKPGSPESSPRLNASVGAIIRLPEEVNFPIEVNRLRAMADVSYKGERFGTVNLHKWMPTNSSLPDDRKYITVQAIVDDAPLDVTDYDVLKKLIGELLSGDRKPLKLGIQGNTDVGVKTHVGEFVVSNIPAAGNITIDAFPGFGSLPLPKVNEIVIADTTPQSATFRINLSIHNPTPWGAIVPYMNVYMTHDNMTLGNASISNLHIVPGNNIVNVLAIWDPYTQGGNEAEKTGAKLIGEYVSGLNTTLTIRPHAESLPSLPLLSHALADFEFTIPTPRLGKIDDPDDDTPPHFIEYATLHVFTSTAEFVIRNPLRNNWITINRINGTAKYNGSDLGTILYEWPFDIRPGKNGKTLTPRLPVDWSMDSVGYKMMRKALGGHLKVHAEALCLVGIGKFEVELFYNSSKPIGAHVRF